MHQQHDSSHEQYPIGRGYGHDYMRGGEVLGGYGYAAREEYELPRGELIAGAPEPGQHGEEQRGGPGGARP
jgi:hypothetical protein